MLPTPTSVRWSSSAALIGVRLPLSRAASAGAVEGLVERLGAQALEQLVVGERRVGRQQHQAEAARIVEADLPALVGVEHDMVVASNGCSAALARRAGSCGPTCRDGRSGCCRRRAAAAGISRAGRWPGPCGLRPAWRTWPATGPGGLVAAAATRTMRRPTSLGTRPRRTVSTSGSSGMPSRCLAPRAPNNAVPTRTWVAPSRTAVS